MTSAQIFKMRDRDPSTISVKEAARGLAAAFDDLAGSEALTRALVCERNDQTQKAMFWVDVYRLVSTTARF